MHPRLTTSRSHRTAFTALVVAVLSTISVLGVATAEPPDDLELVLIASGLSSPVAVRNASDGSDRLFIVEQSGRIKIWDGNQVLATPFLDISGSTLEPPIIAGGEQGLLGLAFHPNYENNGYFFINYTRGSGSGETAVVRRQVSAGNPNIADTGAGSIKQIIVINQNATNHNGGDIHFGPNDGYLYIGMGDGGSSSDPGCRGQRLDDLKGNMLRLDIDTPGDIDPYEIPQGNPFGDETWTYGWRNPWRWSFDRYTGDMFIGDVGQGTREEISFQSASSIGGENFGWKIMEGNFCHDPDPIDNDCPNGTPSCGDPSFIPPLFDYPRTVGTIVTGGYRYRGTRVSGMRGIYVFADSGVNDIFFATETRGNWSFENWLSGPNIRVVSFGEDEEGELYAVNLGGSVLRFESASSIFTDGFESGDTSRWSETSN